MNELVILVLDILFLGFEFSEFPSQVIELFSGPFVFFDLFLKLIVLEGELTIDLVNSVFQGLDIGSSSFALSFVLIAFFGLER
jgi:hypothetical protein